MTAKLIIKEIQERKKFRRINALLNLGITLSVTLVIIIGGVLFYNNTDSRKLKSMDTKEIYLDSNKTVWESIEELNLGVDTREAIHYIIKINNVNESSELLEKKILVPIKGEVVFER